MRPKTMADLSTASARAVSSLDNRFLSRTERLEVVLLVPYFFACWTSWQSTRPFLASLATLTTRWFSRASSSHRAVSRLFHASGISMRFCMATLVIAARVAGAPLNRFISTWLLQFRQCCTLLRNMSYFCRSNLFSSMGQCWTGWINARLTPLAHVEYTIQMLLLRLQRHFLPFSHRHCQWCFVQFRANLSLVAVQMCTTLLESHLFLKAVWTLTAISIKSMTHLKPSTLQHGTRPASRVILHADLCALTPPIWPHSQCITHFHLLVFPDSTAPLASSRKTPRWAAILGNVFKSIQDVMYVSKAASAICNHVHSSRYSLTITWNPSTLVTTCQSPSRAHFTPGLSNVEITQILATSNLYGNQPTSARILSFYLSAPVRWQPPFPQHQRHSATINKNFSHGQLPHTFWVAMVWDNGILDKFVNCFN